MNKEVNMQELKLYVWTEFSPDWMNGLAFAIAESEEEAREQVIKVYGTVYTWGKVKVKPLEKCAYAASGSS